MHKKIDILMKVAFALAVCLSIFQLWQGFTSTLSATFLRPVHLSWVMILVFIVYPFTKDKNSSMYLTGRFIDLILALLALYGGYTIIAFDYQGIDHFLYGLTTHDLIVGTVFMFLVLEATRRSVGWIMAAIGVVFLLYNLFGNYLPDIVANRGFSAERIIRFQLYDSLGIFGAPLGIAATAVFAFVLFGALLEITGAGQFFINLAYAVAGKYRGGPAKASVIASAALGSISGSAIANAVTTGSITIPMMKKLGYKPTQAAGIEAAASTGGQIMPPIMGAGAFIMAEFTDTPYRDIVLISIAPAFLYFFCTLIYVHLMACKSNLKGMTERPSIRSTLAHGAHYILPLLFVIFLLLLDYSPVLVGSAGCIAIVAASFLRSHTRIDLRLLLNGLKTGAIMALPISTACATAGIVVGVIGQTGIGLQFTEFVIALSSGQLWLALILIAATGLILGMGLPVTAAYIVLSVVAAPALQGMGVPLIIAHMVIFWLSQTSNVTPPVALAAFAAAGVAGAKPMPSSIEAFKLAKGFFLIPLMMIYSDLIFLDDTTWFQFISAIIFTVGLIISFACSIEGYAFTEVSSTERMIFLAAIPLIIWSEPISNYVGMVLCVIALTLNYLQYKKPPASMLNAA